MPYGQLLPLSGGDPIPLYRTRLLIGRSRSADISLRFLQICPRHCQLIREHGNWCVEPFGDAVITINGRPLGINEKQTIRSGDQIDLNGPQYRFQESMEPGEGVDLP